MLLLVSSEPMRVTELASHARVSLPTLSGLVTSLEQQRFLKRTARRGPRHPSVFPIDSIKQIAWTNPSAGPMLRPERAADSGRPAKENAMLTVGQPFPAYQLTGVVSSDRDRRLRSADARVRGAQLLGASTDSDYLHLAWRKSHPTLKDLPYPMLSDVKRELSTALGILDAEAGVCLRATFIVDPQGIIRHASVNDLSVGRNPEEVLRVIYALQTS